MFRLYVFARHGSSKVKSMATFQVVYVPFGLPSFNLGFSFGEKEHQAHDPDFVPHLQ
jgi:hypothetical protein